ncbi:XdhC family protein [Nocardia goodfellowii]|uniref:Xanthine dehydrogenase accessory factor n=1 Tax=Nocardia goodfellowii TaxID=882446 RepID=A0ABS4QJP7_9NOCA|nr:XdhC family protein [Nocardia goodfellowii]MBP2191927.1 xanthine dehydrogenase accessory factor [Nocardia goodfellowii]
MRDLAGQLRRWHAANTRYALATVIGVRGSAPRPIGTTMAVDAAGSVCGSLSGGCVEAEVYELCLEVLQTGVPVRKTFGYSDSSAFAVGLNCGGELEVFVHRVTAAEFPVVAAALDIETPVAWVRDVESGAVLAVRADRAIGAGFDIEGADLAVVRLARDLLDTGSSGIRVLGCGDRERTVFVHSFAPPPRMIVFGATDFAIALCAVGRLLGYRVTVCDARRTFLDPDRFAAAHEVVVDWPHRYLSNTAVDARTAICVLSHDPKFDIPVLAQALRLPVAYVGALGSRRADRERRAELRAAGITERQLRQLRSPIGLELGGRTPEETALAIGAEIIALRRGGSATPLSQTERPIHGPEVPARLPEAGGYLNG